MSDDGRKTPEEKNSTNAKLDSLPKDALIKLVQNQILLKKKLDARIAELTTSNLSLCQSEEKFRNQFEDEQIKSEKFFIELEKSENNQKKLQQEIQSLNESLECFRLQNETLKSFCQISSKSESTTDQIVSECLNSLLNQIDEEDRRIFEFISTHSDFFQSMKNSPRPFNLETFLNYFSSLTQKNSFEEISKKSSEEENFRLISKQLSDLLETKIKENNELIERNQQLNDDLKEHREIVFEKTKQSDDLDRQFQKTINENSEIKFQFDQFKEEKLKIIEDLQEKNQKLKILLARLKKDLDEKTQQTKQTHIDLEIADYERTIERLKEQISSKEKDLENSQIVVKNLTEKTILFKDEIEKLEEQKKQTDQRAQQFQNLYETTRRDLLNSKDLENERNQNDENIRNFIDKLQTEIDNNKILLTQLLTDKQQLTDRIHQQNESAQKTIQTLEQNLKISQHDLNVAKQNYETLQDDFNNYKIRAQSVLKQQQMAPRESSSAIHEKQKELEETIEKFRMSLEEATEKIQKFSLEKEILQKENEKLVEFQTKNNSEWKKREQDLRKQHQSEIKSLEENFRKEIDENHQSMENIRKQNEILSKSFQEKIDTIEMEHQNSILNLQNQLKFSKQEIEQLRNRIENLREMNVENDKDSSEIVGNNDLSRDELSWNFAERQQGEGSETASLENQSNDVAVKTLENVLFGHGHHSRSSSSIGVDKPRHILFEDAQLERQRVEEELNKTKYRLLNTTELLNESELNNVRLTEQVSLLKDEIRRMERNIDRTESISNLEYLKNIIFKFLTLKSSDERLQLIPVLVTMLKLSPDEQNKLVQVAHQSTSIDTNSSSVIENSNSNSSSWSSYLNIW